MEVKAKKAEEEVRELAACEEAIKKAEEEAKKKAEEEAAAAAEAAAGRCMMLPLLDALLRVRPVLLLTTVGADDELTSLAPSFASRSACDETPSNLHFVFFPLADKKRKARSVGMVEERERAPQRPPGPLLFSIVEGGRLCIHLCQERSTISIFRKLSG